MEMPMQQLDSPELIVTDVIATHTRLRPNKTAVVCGEERLTWAQFNARVDKVANALLRNGLKKGDKVCLLLQNSTAMLEAMIGTARAGGVTVPLNVMMARDSLAKMINNCQAQFVIANSETKGQVDEIRGQLMMYRRRTSSPLAPPVVTGPPTKLGSRPRQRTTPTSN
jgi:acyl-CoA synthetase (AMP-forming)/AMP-acid ligase II